MSLRQLQFRILCFACTLFGCALTLTGQTPDITGLEKPFPPLEKWRSAIVAGDTSSLRLLYSTNPVAHIQTASGTVDSDAAVHYWIDAKVRDMKIEVVQTQSPQPDEQQFAFQAEIRSAAESAEKTFYITEVQLWQQQRAEWRLIVSKRTDASRLQQPTTSKNIYSAKADAHAEIKEALAKAVKEHKRVLVVFGANWCYDCHVLDLAFQREDVAPLLEDNFVVTHVDIGQGEKNQDLMQQYDVPMERGIPAIAVLDADGKLLFSQKKGEFEKARALAPEDLLDFLNKWKPSAKKT